MKGKKKWVCLGESMVLVSEVVKFSLDKKRSGSAFIIFVLRGNKQVFVEELREGQEEFFLECIGYEG